MAVIVVVSVHGSPGVTTLATALAVMWPDPRWTPVMELDPAGGVLTTRLEVPPTPGIESWAHSGLSGGGVERHAQRARTGTGTEVDVLVGLVGPHRAVDAAARILARPMRAWATARGMVAIVDGGRLYPGSPLRGLLPVADAVVVVTSGAIEAVRQLVAMLPAVRLTAPERVGQVIVGPRNYTTAEIEAQTGVPVWGRLPWDRRGAALLHAPPPSGRWRSTPLRHAVAGVAERLVQRIGPVGQEEQAATEPGGVTALRPAPIARGGVIG